MGGCVEKLGTSRDVKDVLFYYGVIGGVRIQSLFARPEQLHLNHIND